MQHVVNARVLHAGRSGRLMWIDPDRIFYAGLLGSPDVRTLGAYVVYVALDEPFNIAVGSGEWRESKLAVVAPYAPHRIACKDRMLCQLFLEPETLDLNALPEFLRHADGALDDQELGQRIRLACKSLQAMGHIPDDENFNFDQFFFGITLPRGSTSQAIGAVVNRIKRDPANHTAAADCAATACLSLSRFLHRFKEEVGVPFRSFRTWRRARNLLHFVQQDHNLAYLALEIGYPDSTHFSHSVRKIFGLRPKEMFAGARRLAVFSKHQRTLALT